MSWTARELARATGGRWLHKPGRDWSPAAISYNVVAGAAKGHLIVCMTPVSWGGSRPDTARTLPDLIRRGATAAVVQNEQLKAMPRLPKRFPLLLVPNTRRALRDMAIAARERFGGRVLAVTGTVGKTTTREMLRFVLARQGGATANGGNNNNIPGVQRTMASTGADVGYCVLEMGFGNPVDGVGISSDQMRPHVAVVTNVHAAHLDAVESGADPLEEIAGFKSRIFRGLEPDGVAVVGLDHARGARVLDLARQRAARVLSFGATETADVRMVECELRADGSSVTCMLEREPVQFELRLLGRHMAVNAVGVLAAVHAAGADVARAARDLAQFQPVAGRSAVSEFPVTGGTATMIDDAFNATPASVASSLDLLSVIEPKGEGRRIAVLGDILHLGPDAVRLHAGLAEAVERNRVDILFTNGNLMAHLREAVPERVRGSHTSSVRELYLQLRECVRPGDVIALKSGRGRGGLGDREFLHLAQALRKGLDPSLLDERLSTG